MLLLSLVPLVIISYFVIQSTKNSITVTGENIEEDISEYVLYLYKENITRQAEATSIQLEGYKKQILQLRTSLLEAFESSIVPPGYSLHLQQDISGIYWESVKGDSSNSGTTAVYPVTEETVERLEQTKSIEGAMKQIVKSNKAIVAVYYVSPTSAWRIYPAMDAPKEIKDGFLTADVDFTKETFYTAGANVSSDSNAVGWTDPYIDLTHRHEMFSISAPVTGRNGEELGILGADITTHRALNHLLNMKFKEESAYALLLNQHDEFIAYQDKADDDLPFLTKEIRQQISANEQPVLLNVNGLNKIFLSATIDHSGWKLIFAIPEAGIIDHIKSLTDRELTAHKQTIFSHLRNIMIFTLLVIIFCSIAIWRNFTNPIREILGGIRSFQNENFKSVIPKQSLHEFNVVSQSFNSMSQRINKLIGNYQTLNSQLEDKVSERTQQLVRLNISLIETNKKLQETEQQRKLLFANIAHDLKTPITLIHGYIEAIQDGLIGEDDYEMYFNRIQNHLDSINNLVVNASELNRIDLKEQPFHFKRVDTVSFFQEIKNNFIRYEQIAFDIEPDLPPLNIDVHYIERALMNLIKNALKYSEPDTPIAVQVRQQDQHAVITVKDAGWGISDTDLPYIFDRFYRVSKVRNSNKPGTGLGLSIVKEVMNAHGGTIVAHSELGIGTEFTITLPFPTDADGVSS
ncbi:ATP-binding protein [Sporosarcina sp. 179-K 3D1 HS]|uniref:sensor histidine kinase n=1 Tax=Sporosarcina sp. 179-K 3D1 HS TaxID=3232169 RepID=UPI0039A28B6E